MNNPGECREAFLCNRLAFQYTLDEAYITEVIACQSHISLHCYTINYSSDQTSDGSPSWSPTWRNYATEKIHGWSFRVIPIAISAPKSVARKFTTSLFIQDMPRNDLVLVPQVCMRRSVSLSQVGQ